MVPSYRCATVQRRYLLPMGMALPSLGRADTRKGERGAV